MLAAVHPDKLLAGGLAGVDLEQPFRHGRKFEADLFARLAQGAGAVFFAGIDVARDGRVPCAGEAVFFHRALLQEQLALGVEDEQVNGAMPQAKPVHLDARLLADDLVVCIDDVEDLFELLGKKDVRVELVEQDKKTRSDTEDAGSDDRGEKPRRARRKRDDAEAEPPREKPSRSAKDKPREGTIICVGDGRLNHDTGDREPFTVATGDRVLFTSYAGTEVKIDDTDYIIMTEEDILGIVE